MASDRDSSAFTANGCTFQMQRKQEDPLKHSFRWLGCPMFLTASMGLVSASSLLGSKGMNTSLLTEEESTLSTFRFLALPDFDSNEESDNDDDDDDDEPRYRGNALERARAAAGQVACNRLINFLAHQP